jgi:low affinity Fe/Cu permease
LTSWSVKFGLTSWFYRTHSLAADLLQKEKEMLETIAIILVVLWLLGFVTSYTMGGFIHILLVVAVVVILIRVIQGRRL